MRKRLTKTIVEEITPGPRDVIVWDTVCPGFGVKVTPRGRRIYFAYYRTRGRQQRRPKIAEHGVLSVDQARDRARQILGDVAAGSDPSGELVRLRQRSITLDQLWDSHLPDARARWRKRTAYECERRWMRHVSPRLGALPIRALSSADVRAMHADLKDRKVEANNCVALVRLILNVAIAREIIPGPNVAAAVKPYKETSRELFLSREQLVCLLRAIDAEEAIGGRTSVKGRVGKSCGQGGKGLKEATSRGITPHAAALFRLLIYTGARLNEIQSARWDWIDWGRGGLRLPDLASKTGKKVVWLSDLAIEELRRLQAIRSQDVWIIEGRRLYAHLVNAEKPWRRVRDHAAKLLEERIEKHPETEGSPADLRVVRLHDLRHTFASFGVAAGVPLYTVGKALGHAKASTTERYAHVSDNPLKAAVDVISETIRTARAEASANVLAIVPRHVKKQESSG